jgi:hypothetical protein
MLETVEVFGAYGRQSRGFDFISYLKGVISIVLRIA